MKLTIERIEAVHPEVARALRVLSGTERLRLAHEEWDSEREIPQDVARRLLDDSSRAASPPR